MYDLRDGHANQVIKEQPIAEASNHRPDALPFGERDHDAERNVVHDEIRHAGEGKPKQPAFRHIREPGPVIDPRGSHSRQCQARGVE